MEKVNFVGRLEGNEGATMIFIVEKTEETTFNFSQNTASIIWNGNTKNHNLVK